MLERRVVEDEAALEFHRDGALTFRGLESIGIIDRPPRLPFNERPCYPIPSDMVMTTASCDRTAERDRVDFVLSDSSLSRKRSGTN